MKNSGVPRCPTPPKCFWNDYSIYQYGEIVLSKRAQHTNIGETVVLPCKYPHGAKKIRWRRWQGIIARGSDLKLKNADDRKRFKVAADQMKGEYNLETADVDRSDSGLYWCEMRFGGKIMQQKVTLYIENFNKDEIPAVGYYPQRFGRRYNCLRKTVPDFHYSVDTFGESIVSDIITNHYVGETAILSCNFSDDASSNRWRRVGEIISTSSNITLADPEGKHFNVVEDEEQDKYNLEICNVTKLDAGLYWCEMQRDGQITQQRVTLFILGKLTLRCDFLQDGNISTKFERKISNIL
ncbi:Hypothetical predicted protein [Mytilus galloprovincialis]|uniref:Ig-like domain-containing protein n=1 Tax=Mytilus galloprovincialis TaxID=29158 RepID=A0A8B6EUW0_MYTGA|nr:Hypothetical predicted protein [Mytilus galloprovincialis]